MLASIQRGIVFVLLLSMAILIFASALLNNSTFWLLWPIALFAGYASVLAVEFALLWRSYAAVDPLRPRVGQLVAAWIGETACAPRVFLWRQPFRSKLRPDYLPSVATGRRGVLLIHGFFCNRGIWNFWMRHLRERDVPFVGLNLEPLFASIDTYSDRIDAAIDKLEQATGMAPIIVAHSMGGLASRAWLASASTDPKRVRRLVTIATPHAGTQMAARGSGENIRQMRVGSDWLRGLAAREDAGMRARVVCFWSHCDNIVVPARSATLEGANNRHLPATPHVQMVDHPEIVAAVLELLAADEPPSASNGTDFG